MSSPGDDSAAAARPSKGPVVTRLERAELYLVRLVLIHEFQTSSHRKRHLDHILIRVTDSDGVTGWGESACASHPFVSGENVGTCWMILHDYLVPALLGVPWDSPEQASASLARFSGNHFARAGLDIACWDLDARRRGCSVAEALGGTAAQVEAGVSLGIEDSIGTLLTQVTRYQAQGYRRAKLKIGPGWDLEPTRTVRKTFPDIALQVDANGAYHPGPAADELFAALDDLGLIMIEQPFGQTELLAHAELQPRLQTPICLDETITTLGMAQAALALGACRIINVKASRMGGLTPARQLHDFCRTSGIPLWCGGMHEFGVGRAANVALASLPGFTLPSDVSGSDKYFAEDLVEPAIRALDGRVPVPYHRPGLGHDIVPGRVEAHLLKTASLRPEKKGKKAHARADFR